MKRESPSILDPRWHILTIGHLSRNKFWGEADEQAYRTPLCTCTSIQVGEHTIVVDPSYPPDRMVQVLDERVGLTVDDVDIVFLTHFHGDHRVGVGAFPNARWYMAAEEIESWDRQLPADSPDRQILTRLQPVSGTLVPGIELLATPGHTLGHTSLVFTSDGLRVVVAGDAVMTRDFFMAREYYFNTVDPAAAVRSMESIAEVADIVVSGHDNYFLNRG